MASISTAQPSASANPVAAATGSAGCAPPAANGTKGPKGSNGANAASAATPGSAKDSPDDTTSDGFNQLLSDMLNSDGSAQTGMPLSAQELAALGLGEKAGKSTDTDQDLDGEGSDAAGALAVAAFLPGLCVAPAPVNTAGTAGGADSQALDIGAAITAARLTADPSKTATDALGGDGTDAAGNAQPNAAEGTGNTQSANQSAQMHSLMASHRVADADAVPDGTLRAPVGTHQWRDELGAQLTLMVHNGRETASLRLSPENLGPLEIRISMQDGAASVWFGANSADTRSALEQSMPRLREMFASQGLVLADAGVSRDPSRNQFRPGSFSGGSRGSSDAAPEQSVKSITLARLGLIDTYV
ncbi:MAG: flagellar hook-length control protein FliK [Gammaproteobacteria bacterium]